MSSFIYLSKTIRSTLNSNAKELALTAKIFIVLGLSMFIFANVVTLYKILPFVSFSVDGAVTFVQMLFDPSFILDKLHGSLLLISLSLVSLYFARIYIITKTRSDLLEQKSGIISTLFFAFGLKCSACGGVILSFLGQVFGTGFLGQSFISELSYIMLGLSISFSTLSLILIESKRIHPTSC